MDGTGIPGGTGRAKRGEIGETTTIHCHVERNKVVRLRTTLWSRETCFTSAAVENRFTFDSFAVLSRSGQALDSAFRFDERIEMLRSE